MAINPMQSEKEARNALFKKMLMCVGVGIVALVLAGYVAQSMGYLMSLGNSWNRKEFTLNPFKSLIYCVSTKYGWISIALLIFVATAVVVYLRHYDKFYGRDNDARGFKRSSKGTYGTASLMDKNDIKRIMSVKPIEDTYGTILGTLGKKEIVSVPTNQKGIQLNPHVAVYGASGSGKSWSFVRPQIFQCAKRRESIIVTDSKGEMYRDTSILLRKMGYNVKVFNLVNPDNSDAWNCFGDMTGTEDYLFMCQQLAESVVKNTQVGGKPGLFDAQIQSLLTSLALYVLLDRNRAPEDKSLGAIYRLLTSKTSEELENLVNSANIEWQIENRGEEHPCRAPFQPFIEASPNAKANIKSSLGSKLQLLQNPRIDNITKYNEISLTRPGKEPCAYFVLMSDQDNTMNFLSALFFNFLFISLVRYADSTPNGMCQVPVNFILDEFVNIGQIPDFTKKLSTVRSRGLSVSCIFQNISQLETQYTQDGATIILGNCDTQLVLGVSADPKTAKLVTDLCGTMTVNVNSTRFAQHSMQVAEIIPAYQTTEGLGKRDVFTPDEVRRLSKNSVIVIVRGQNPFVCDKYDYTKHPYARQLVRASPVKHIPVWRRRDMERREEANKHMCQAGAGRRPPADNPFGAPGGTEPDAMNIPTLAFDDSRINKNARENKSRAAPSSGSAHSYGNGNGKPSPPSLAAREQRTPSNFFDTKETDSLVKANPLPESVNPSANTNQPGPDMRSQDVRPHRAKLSEIKPSDGY